MNKIIWPWMESDRSVSARRVLALFFAAAAIVLFWKAFEVADKGWQVFIPGGICIIAALILLFFTTWAEITALIQAALGGGIPRAPGASGS